MGEDKEDKKALFESVVRAWAWRMESAGEPADKIADEINERFGKGRQITDASRIAECLAGERAFRDSPVTTPQDATIRLIDMVELLRGELTIARTNFNTRPDDHGRGGALIALTAVCEFVERFEDMRRDRLSDPLRALMVALVELDKPVIHPMLTPAKKNSRPPASQGWETLAGLSAAAMEGAMREGMNLKQASHAVSKELHRRGYRQSAGKPITPTTVAAWRARAAEGPGGAFDGPHARLQTVRRAHATGMQIQPGAWKRILDGLGGWDRVAGIRKMPPSLCEGQPDR